MLLLDTVERRRKVRHERRTVARLDRLLATLVALKQGDHVQVWSRHGVDFTNRFSRIAEVVRDLPVAEALVDGEAVVFRDYGRSDFYALMTKRGGTQASFVAFDLLHLNDDGLRLRPIEARREARYAPRRRGQ